MCRRSVLTKSQGCPGFSSPNRVIFPPSTFLPVKTGTGRDASPHGVGWPAARAGRWESAWIAARQAPAPGPMAASHPRASSPHRARPAALRGSPSPVTQPRTRLASSDGHAHQAPTPPVGLVRTCQQPFLTTPLPRVAEPATWVRDSVTAVLKLPPDIPTHIDRCHSEGSGDRGLAAAPRDGGHRADTVTVRDPSHTAGERSSACPQQSRPTPHAPT